MGTALAFSISGIVREEPGAIGWLWNLAPAYSSSLDNSHTQQGVNFPGTIGSEIVWKFCLWCPTNLKQLTMTFRKLSQ